MSEMSVKEAKKYLRDNWDKGVNCPCCGQRVHKRKETLSAGKVFWLIHLYRLNRQSPYVHARDVLDQCKDTMASVDYSKLKWWGLIEQKPKDAEDDEDKRTSGLYRITDMGKLFVENKVTVNKALFVFNSIIAGRTTEMVGIRDALGTKFSYSELMRGHE